MALSPQHSARRLPCKTSIFLVLLCVVVAACSTTGQSGKIIFEDPRGSVTLQTISDRSIQATHPINLEPALLAKVLSGMEVQDQERGVQKLLAGSSSPVPVFSEDQIQFLAPLLAEALRNASPNQSIEYLVRTTYEGSLLESAVTETTAGSFYAYGRSLYMTLSQYRYSPSQANLNISETAYRMSRTDSSGLRSRILLFTPSSAQRSDALNPESGGKSTDRFLAIDYQLLQQMHPTAATTGRTAPMSESSVGTSSSGTSAQTTDALAQEVETLKKQLESIQKQIGNQKQQRK